MPRASILLFCARDSNAVGASFIVPQALCGLLGSCMPGMGMTTVEAACQLLAPPVCELVNTPLHLLALDVYNRPSKGPGDRAGAVRNAYLRLLPVRALRATTAFALGGLGNKAIRGSLRYLLETSAAASAQLALAC